MYATTTTGHRSNVTKSKETKVLQQLYSLGTLMGVILQDTVTTTEEWFGLTQTDAETQCTASETSTLNGTTRNYLGSAKLSVNGTGGAWCRMPNCWGERVTSQMNRMSDTNLYHVTRTTTTLSVRSSGTDITLTLE